MAFAVVAGLVAALAGGIASVAGFGIGSLLTPLVAMRYGMKVAVPMVSIPHAIATLLRFWRLRREVDRRILAGFGLMNVLGALAGAWLHSRAHSAALDILLGALLVFAGAVGLVSYAGRMRFGRKTAWIAGTLSGIFGGLVGNQGGIRSAAMLGLDVEGTAFVATATAIALAVDAARMPVYFITQAGRIAAGWQWPDVTALTAGVVIGTLAGERVLRRIPGRLFRKVVSGVLLGIGALLLAGSCSTLISK